MQLLYFFDFSGLNSVPNRSKALTKRIYIAEDLQTCRFSLLKVRQLVPGI